MKLSKGLRALIAAAAAFLLLYTIFGFILFPMLLKKVSVEHLARFLGRTVTINEIRFNPYRMSIMVSRLQIDEPAGGTIFSLEEFRGTFAPWSSLFHRTWAFRDIALRTPSVNITRFANGTLSFADLLLLDWPQNLRVAAHQVRVFDGKVRFQDAAVPGGFSTNLNGLNVSLSDFSTSPGHPSSFSISAVTDAGERVSCNGIIRLHPVSSRGEIAVESIPLERYSRYLPDRFTFTVAAGELSVRSSYEVDLSREHFTLLLRNGTVAARSLMVAEQGSMTPVFSFEKFALKGATVDLVRQTIRIDSIDLTGGSAVVRRRADNTFNIQHLLKPALPVTQPDPASSWNVAVNEIRIADFTAALSRVFGRQTVQWKELMLSTATIQTSPFAASMSGLKLQDGEILFTDPSMTPPLAMALTHLDVRIGGFSSAHPRPASVAVTSRIGDAAEFQISGETNPFGERGKTNLRGLLRNLSLRPLSPYAARYLGYDLAAGDLNLDVSLLIRGRKLDAQNTIQINNLAFGEKTESRDATKLPVRLAIFLLTDARGTITLKIPINTRMDDSSFKIQKTLIAALLTPLQKTIAFPFSLLGMNPGNEDKELAVQEFAHGSAALLPQESSKLDRILQGLKQWPELMLDIEGSIDAEKDSGDLSLLASDRARAVREYLLHEGTLEPARVFLISNSMTNIPRSGSRALLSLKDRYRHP